MNRFSSASIRSRLLSAVAYHGAWVVLVYSALRYLALARHDHTYGDSTAIPLRRVCHCSRRVLGGFALVHDPALLEAARQQRIANNNRPVPCFGRLLVGACLGGRGTVEPCAWCVGSPTSLFSVLALTGPVAQWDRDFAERDKKPLVMEMPIALAIRLIKPPLRRAARSHTVCGDSLGIRA